MAFVDLLHRRAHVTQKFKFFDQLLIDGYVQQDRGGFATSAISDSDAATQSAPDKWSPNQVIGHLIDSASDNDQRFVRANFVEDLIFPGYDQEKWVELGRYADTPWESLLAL